jgi:vancomycin resistance protein YoaR
VIIVAAVCVGVLLLAVAVDAVASLGRIHPGVTVVGVSVGGMTPAQASNALSTQLPAKSAAPVTVTYQDQSWTVNPADVGLAFDYPKIVEASMAVGRSGNVFVRVRDRVSAWFGGVKVAAIALSDPTRLAATIAKISDGTDVAPKDATLDIKGTDISVKPAADGIELQKVPFTAALFAAFTSTERKVAAPVQAAKPKISDAAATSAKKVVATMISAPMTVTYASKSWTFEPAEIAKLVAFRAIEASGSAKGASGGWVLDPFISATEASKTLAPKLGADIGKPAKDASFKTRSGTVVIIPSEEGVGPDLESLSANLTEILKDPASSERAVELRTKTTQPKVTTEAAKAMGIKERISTFTTSYDGGNEPRVNNIHTLGDALDAKLVPPGGTFSFNGAVGERTAAKGYQEANAIVNGKLVPQLGGGICQVGTTLFNTIFLSGLPITQRQNHSFYISHYPKGRDATVSWGGPDLKWKNDTANWVLVSVSYTSSSITISLYGTSPGNEVTFTTGPFTNETPFPTESVNDPTLAAGMKVVQDKGETGKKCVVTRTVTRGGQVVRTDTFTSNYKPKVEVVRVGTKVKGSKTVTPTVTPVKP